MTFFQQSWDVGTFIRDGTFDRFLLRPADPLFQLFCIRFQKIAFSQMLAGIILFIISSIYLNLEWSIIKLIFLFVTIISGMLVYMGITLIVSSLSFWFVQVNSILTIITSINYEFMQYPMSVYPIGLQIVLTFILPFAFMSYIPAQFLLGVINMEFPKFIIYASPVMGGIVFFISILIFKIGINHYNSTGN